MAKKKQRSCQSRIVDLFVPELGPSLNDLVGHIPLIGKDALPGDMEDAYGSIEHNLRSRDETVLIRIPREFMCHAGIGLMDNADTILYIRPRTLTQIVFMNRDVLEYGYVGHIFGQPGTGKSTTALFFAARIAVEKRWSVLWAHLSVGNPDNCWVCMHMRPDGSYMPLNLDDAGMAEYLREFGRRQNSDGALGYCVVLDGMKFDGNAKKIPARLWYLENPRERRLILISSDGVDTGLSGGERNEKKIRIFRQWSWKMEDYEAALSISAFKTHVANFFDSPDAPDVPDGLSGTARRLHNKFFVAGGCARWMFTCTSSEAQADIDGAVVKGFQSGEVMPRIVSRLFSRCTRTDISIVSEYAKQRMLESMGTMQLNALKRHPMIAQCDNGALGQLFQLYVYFDAYERTARKDAVTFRNRSGIDLAVRFQSVVRAHIQTLNRSDCLLMTLIWPYSFYQPAFDGFYITKVGSEDMIVFLQVTVGEEHSVDLLKLMTLMERFNVQFCEFYFIIPMHMMAKFKIGAILNPKALIDFGWPTDDAGIRKRIQICGLDGWGNG